MPNKLEATTNSHRPVAPPVVRTISMAPTKAATAKAIFTTWRSRLCIQGGVDSQPCSLAIATIDPVKVIEPTKTDTTIDTSATGPVASRAIGSKAAAKATSNDDIPPQPLNNATVSGIDVMGTRWAVITPRTPPTMLPPTIQAQAWVSNVGTPT